MWYAKVALITLWRLEGSTSYVQHGTLPFPGRYWILSAIDTPYHKVAINPVRFKSDDIPCILLNALFNFCISSEWGAGS